MLLLPIYLAVFYTLRLKQWNDEEFKAKYGSLIDGTNRNLKSKQWLVLIIPCTYFARRITFALTVVFWFDFFWGQIGVQFLVTTFMIIFLQWTRPLESKFATTFETFNEVANLMSLYPLLCFSDFISEPEIRSTCGWAFIVIICAYAMVHLGFLITDVIQKLKGYLKRNCCLAFWKNKALQAKAKREEADRIKINEKIQRKLDAIGEAPSVAESSLSDLPDEQSVEEPAGQLQELNDDDKK